MKNVEGHFLYSFHPIRRYKQCIMRFVPYLCAQNDLNETPYFVEIRSHGAFRTRGLIKSLSYVLNLSGKKGS